MSRNFKSTKIRHMWWNSADHNRHHSVELLSGHVVHIAFSLTDKQWKAYYFSVTSGGHWLGRHTAKELVSLIRLRVMQDLHPDLSATMKRVGAKP